MTPAARPRPVRRGSGASRRRHQGLGRNLPHETTGQTVLDVERRAPAADADQTRYRGPARDGTRNLCAARPATVHLFLDLPSLRDPAAGHKPRAGERHAADRADPSRCGSGGRGAPLSRAVGHTRYSTAAETRAWPHSPGQKRPRSHGRHCSTPPTRCGSSRTNWSMSRVCSGHARMASQQPAQPGPRTAIPEPTTK